MPDSTAPNSAPRDPRPSDSSFRNTPAKKPERELGSTSLHNQHQRPEPAVATLRSPTDLPDEPSPQPIGRNLYGPSFLGLSDEADESEENTRNQYSYLYDDEEKPRRSVNWRLVAALLILVTFGAILAYQWKKGANWNSTIVRLTKGDVAKQPPPEIVAQTESTTPGVPEIAVTENTGGKAAATPDKGQMPQSDAEGSGFAASAQADAAPKSDESQTPGSGDATGAGPDDADSSAADAETNAKRAEADNGSERNAAGQADDEQSSRSKPEAAKARRQERTEEEDTSAADNALVARAEAYLYGKGVPKSCPTAVDMLRDAALRGNARARSRLGGLYATGNCVELDRAEAYNWFTLARDLDPGNRWVIRNREMLWSQMSESERDRVLRR